MAGKATKDWPMSSIFSLKCCEHKEGPAEPQMRPLAFNCLCMYTILYSYSEPTLHPLPISPISPPFAVITHQKAAQNCLNLGICKLFTHTITADMLGNFISSAQYTRKLQYNQYFKSSYLWTSLMRGSRVLSKVHVKYMVKVAI